MKKLITFLLLFCFVTPAYGAIEPPKWEEFCPPQYCNATYIEDKTMGAGTMFLLAISIVGIPWALHDANKYNSIQVNNYWVNRKEAFINSVMQCNNITDKDELIYKYNTIRQTELAKNNTYNLNTMNAQQQQIINMQNYQILQNNQNNNRNRDLYHHINYGY